MQKTDAEEDPIISSRTLNWRGIMALSTSTLFKQLGFASNMLTLLAVRSLRGSVSVYANYMGTSGGGNVT